MVPSRKPLVSVCLPVYNGERFLREAISCVLAQSYDNIELIISDDGSTDDSWNIIQTFNDKRILSFKTPGRMGVFGNYNECIKRARGDYVKYFAQDDLLTRNHIASCVAAFQANPQVVLVATKRNWIDPNGVDVSLTYNTPSSESVLPSNQSVPGMDCIRRCLVPPVNYIGEPATVMIRRDISDYGFDTRYHHLGDLEYWLRTLLRGDYYFIDRVMCSFRIHEKNQTHKNMREFKFIPDMLRIGQQFGELADIDKATFERACVEAAASKTDNDSFSQLPSLDSPSFDSAAFAHFAVIALREVRLATEARHLHERVMIIESLERRLQTLLASSSWRGTKFLRDANSRLAPIPVARPSGSPTAVQTVADHQSYIRYLQDQIDKITRSRSWKITEPIRAAGLIDKGLTDDSVEVVGVSIIEPSEDADFLSFSGARYLERYPDVAESGADPLVHYLELGLAEGRVARQFASINAGVVALSKSDKFARAVEIVRQQILAAPVSHIFVSGVLTRGGAERSACSYMRAIGERVGMSNVALLVTDQSAMTCTDWAPEGARIINLLEIEPELTGEERALLMMESLRVAGAKLVVGFNSETFWAGMDCHVNLWTKEIDSKFFGYLGSYELFVNENEWGFVDGAMHRLAPNMHGFITENERIRKEMIRRYTHVPNIESRVTTVYKSLLPELHARLRDKRASLSALSSNRVLWAGRLDRIKRPDLLQEIASQMPEVQFDVYGWEPGRTDISGLRKLPNVHLNGEFADFSAIDTSNKAVLLYTSEADGMPHILLEAACAGVPIVAAAAGGISEFVNERTGWLVHDFSRASDYVSALRAALCQPEEARLRAGNAALVVDTRHSWDAFVERVGRLNIWESETTGEVKATFNLQPVCNSG